MSVWIGRSAAKEIGAVNTIVVQRDELHGFNTDADALSADSTEDWRITRGALRVIGAVAPRVPPCGACDRSAEVTVFARDAGKARRWLSDLAPPRSP